MEPDSGAEVNLMDEHQFQALLHRTHEKPTLEHCQIKLNTLQHPLHVKGKFETLIRNISNLWKARNICCREREDKFTTTPQ
jgi:hypothetical protein